MGLLQLDSKPKLSSTRHNSPRWKVLVYCLSHATIDLMNGVNFALDTERQCLPQNSFCQGWSQHRCANVLQPLSSSRPVTVLNSICLQILPKLLPPVSSLHLSAIKAQQCCGDVSKSEAAIDSLLALFQTNGKSSILLLCICMHACVYINRRWEGLLDLAILKSFLF